MRLWDCLYLWSSHFLVNLDSYRGVRLLFLWHHWCQLPSWNHKSIAVLSAFTENLREQQVSLHLNLTLCAIWTRESLRTSPNYQCMLFIQLEQMRYVIDHFTSLFHVVSLLYLQEHYLGVSGKFNLNWLLIVAPFLLTMLAGLSSAVWGIKYQ